jgi:hypothetical protein
MAEPRTPTEFEHLAQAAGIDADEFRVLLEQLVEDARRTGEASR